MTGRIRLGTSSFSEKDWVGPFYPEGTRPADYLTYYATRYDSVEIDATYYRIPSGQTVDGWDRKTPEGFLFAAKFPRSIVHAGDGPKPNGEIILRPDRTNDERDRFLDVMSRLGDKLGPLVLQFPYFNKSVFKAPEPFFERLDRFLGDVPKAFRLAVEIRNRRWLTGEFRTILRRHGAALVLMDHPWMPHGDELEQRLDPLTTDFVYIRLLGDRKAIEAVTTSWEKEVIDQGERLERWARLIGRLLARDVEVLTYINNHYAGHAPATAERLRDLLD